MLSFLQHFGMSLFSQLAACSSIFLSARHTPRWWSHLVVDVDKQERIVAKFHVLVIHNQTKIKISLKNASWRNQLVEKTKQRVKCNIHPLKILRLDLNVENLRKFLSNKFYLISTRCYLVFQCIDTFMLSPSAPHTPNTIFPSFTIAFIYFSNS